VAAGALTLAGAAPADATPLTAVPVAAISSSLDSLDEAPSADEVAATATVEATERSRRYRKATVKASKRLTSKVKVTVKASARVGRTVRKTRSATVTSYAPTEDEAVAEAKAAAREAAHERAAKAARQAAGKKALARATSVARKKAKAKAKVAVRKKFRSVVVHRAAAQRGKPYRYGAKGPSSFDCSGLVNYVMKGAGVKHLKRTSSGLATQAHRISKSKRKPGDLVFFSNGGHVYHVGIYAGGGKMWHAPGSGRSVKKAKIWTSHYRIGRLPA
jgi:cell wall-associated NlpC family hydrolase